jgi:Flp pilus assembly protein TadD
MAARPTPIQTAEALIRAGDLARARATMEQALRRAPGEPGLNALLARLLIMMGERDRAIYHLERLLSARPGDPAALGALAEQLLEGGRAEEAERRAARLIDAGAAPAAPRIASKLAVVMQSFGRHRASLELGEWAHEREPGDARIASYCAAARIFTGDHAGAAAVLREAAGARGVDPDLQRDPLLLMLYCPQFSAREVFEAHRLYGRLMNRARPPRPAPIRDPDPDRPLRVGYISQDFRNRSAGHFIEGIVAHHDRARVRPWCYSHRLRVDALTERVRAHAEGFREIHAMTDDQAAERIRSDGIDIAVDLTGHTGLNRLAVLATKPAPVQATYMGYAATTGLPVIDYRLVDAHTDPEPDADGLSTERLIRLDPCFLCYTPPAHAPEVSACPAEASGRIVFASFNTFAKITDEMLGAWARLLREVPGSGLLVKNAGLADPWLCERFRERFARLGGDPARLETLGETPTEAEHMGLYARVDIALDTFPYHGTTTTLEAMWMGVPVVTLEGDSHVSRVGVSLLRNTGMDDLIARDPASYVEIAARLARDADRLRILRGSLRGIVRDCLCDFASFVPRLESAYRLMWRRACGVEP